MKTPSYALRRMGFPTRRSLPLRTTLYDLIEAIANEVGFDEEVFVTPTAMHLLGSHRVRFIGKRVRHRPCSQEANYLNSASA